MFFSFFFFTSQVLNLLSQVKITLNIYIFKFLKDIFVVLQPYIILGVFFIILVTTAALHLKFSTRVSPSNILTRVLESL